QPPIRRVMPALHQIPRETIAPAAPWPSTCCAARPPTACGPTPNGRRAYPSGDVRRDELRRPLGHVAVAGGEDDEVGGERRAIRQHDRALAELRQADTSLQLDSAVDDHLRGADVDVVARAAAQINRVQAGAVLAHVVEEA